MALDVHLTRNEGEPWGFQLVGGADYEMPLSVQQIQPNSPAKRAGLQNGDTILLIDGDEAIDLPLEEARRKIADAAQELTFGVVRGLYDPVLDDSEPIYEYQPDDLDQPLEPTEVPFEIQQFLEPNYGPTLDPTLGDDRSLTASPFVRASTPYRPFSAEPLPEIPPLEDPIILNPNYRDQFGKSPADIDFNPDSLLNINNNTIGSRFKLPISKQYDPDGTKKVNTIEIEEKLMKNESHVKCLDKDLEVLDKIVKTVEKEAEENKMTFNTNVKDEISISKSLHTNVLESIENITHTESIRKECKERSETETKLKEKFTEDEQMYSESSKQEIDIRNIEKTALSVVENSIERAVSITKEIQQEIEAELLETKRDYEETNVTNASELKNVEKIDKEVVEKNICDLKEIVKHDSIDTKHQTQVKSHDEVKNVSKKDFKASETSEFVTGEHETREYDEKHYKQKSATHTSNIKNQTNFAKVKETLTNGIESENDSAFIIGLQSIPNIRGVVHSSYHYNLLLQTFFIHLTDVMVALSRFLLTQPIFNQQLQSTSTKVECRSEVNKRSEQEKEYSKENKVVEEVRKESVTSHKQKEMTALNIEQKQLQAKNIDTSEVIKPISMKTVQQEIKLESNQEQDIQVIEATEKKTGAEMAQRCEKKLSKDLTQKMDAVITQFQSVAIEDDKKETLERNRRSRSRSHIEEEVKKVGDPLDWLEMTSQTCETSKQEVSKKFTSKVEETIESTRETRQRSKSPKQTYVAIVESHVFTNPDTILEEQVEFSETSSVQSAEEVNTAFEAIEAVTTENLALENAVRELETVQVLDETQKFATVTAKSAVKVEEKHESRKTEEYIEQKVNKEKISQSEVQSVVVKENQVATEAASNVVETKSQKASINITESLSVAESSEINKYQHKNETQIVEKVQEKAVANEIKSEIEVVPPEVIDLGDSKETTDVCRIATAEITEKACLESIKKQMKLDLNTHKVETHVNSMHTAMSHTEIQESSFTAKAFVKDLTLNTSIDRQTSSSSIPSTIDTPTPSTVPPTPLTDEYMFQLSMPLPRSITPVPRDCSVTPEDEDPHIVKKKLIPHIDTIIEQKVYDHPLPSPDINKVQSPVYTKPGLSGGNDKQFLGKETPYYVPGLSKGNECLAKKVTPVYRKPGLFGGAVEYGWLKPVYKRPGLYGGADKLEVTQEEIREIERKSSLLASAIDETIKSIEEYKEEVGMESKKEVTVSFKKEKQSTATESYTHVQMQNGNSCLEEYSVSSDDGSTVKDTAQNCTENFSEVQTMQNGNNNLEEYTVSSDDGSVQKYKVQNGTEIEEIQEENLSIERKDSQVESEFTVKMVKYGEVDEKRAERFQSVIAEFNATLKKEKNGVINTEINGNDNRQEIESVTLKRDSINISENAQECKEVNGFSEPTNIEDKNDPMKGYRPVVFDPEAIQKRNLTNGVYHESPGSQEPRQSPYITESGEVYGTFQGIVDSLEEQVVDEKTAKEIGKPGISEDKIAELISGEAEMLREAHVMGLSRVLTSHMHRLDDSSVDFQKIKPMIDSLKHSEVLKALNEELLRKKAEEKKKDEKKWTTFLQKPRRPVPKAKFGYHGYVDEEETVAEPYKVKIVKQSKPKVAPDYKPEDFETGPLPWEQRAATEAELPPVLPEDPILIPELPQFLEAVDPLKESEVPDLEDTGIPLPKDPTPPPEENNIIEDIIEEQIEEEVKEQEEEVTEVEEKTETREEMENRLADQLVKGVQSMVDPTAPVEQQLSQMRAQLAALAQLPEVIQQTLQLVSQQLNQMTHKGVHFEVPESEENKISEQVEKVEENHVTFDEEETQHLLEESLTEEEEHRNNEIEEQEETQKEEKVIENRRMLKTPEFCEEDARIEKQKKDEALLDFEARQIKTHATPRSTNPKNNNKPQKVFGLDSEERLAVVLPGGRKWRGAKDVYDEQMFTEAMKAQAELIQGKALGVNFLKYEKPPVTLDHLKHSEVYKLVHDMDHTPVKRVEMLTPVIAEADYRERCRSATPAGVTKHAQIPMQFHP